MVGVVRNVGIVVPEIREGEVLLAAEVDRVELSNLSLELVT